MPDLTLACVVTRTELGLGNLDLNQAPYEIARNGLRPGKVTRRRQRVDSPFVHGELEVHSVKASPNLDLRIRVVAATDAAMWTAIDAAVAAFEQTSYTVTITIDGQQRAYQCDPADYALSDDGEIDTTLIVGHRQILTVSAPRSPVPLVGAI